MVKGISRRVVVVKAPVGSIFDEAIFIMRDDVPSSADVDAEKILREACSAADEYVRENCTDRKRVFRPNVLLLLSGAVALILIALLLVLCI